WRLMRELMETGDRPPIIVIENVVGLLYGDSFVGLCEAFAALNMQFGALVMDARQFLPQSRPRVFLVGVDSAIDCSAFISDRPATGWVPRHLFSASQRLPKRLHPCWRWWKLPIPLSGKYSLRKIIERTPRYVEWHTARQTDALLAMMNEA